MGGDRIMLVLILAWQSTMLQLFPAVTIAHISWAHPTSEAMGAILSYVKLKVPTIPTKIYSII
jgi:hypothetical protein